jgi:hypothetical protein
MTAGVRAEISTHDECDDYDDDDNDMNTKGTSVAGYAKKKMRSVYQGRAENIPK